MKKEISGKWVSIILLAVYTVATDGLEAYRNLPKKVEEYGRLTREVGANMDLLETRVEGRVRQVEYAYRFFRDLELAILGEPGYDSYLSRHLITLYDDVGIVHTFRIVRDVDSEKGD